MTTEWRITQKPDFFKALLALPPKETHQVLEKIELLAQDPTPDAKAKKQLKYMNGKLHRIRSGDYRIFYTFEYPYISILALHRRNDDTYDEDLDVEFLGGLDLQFEDRSGAKAAQPDWEKWLAPKEPEKRRLPEPISKELLVSLHIPPECHARLLPIQTEEDLLDCPGIPEEYLLAIDQYMFERPLVQVLQQPDYLLNDVNDLLRYKEGELLGFLLKLSPEQEKYVTWGINGTGPTLLKGGPGTGKSTIALYRVRALVQELVLRRDRDQHARGHEQHRLAQLVLRTDEHPDHEGEHAQQPRGRAALRRYRVDAPPQPAAELDAVEFMPTAKVEWLQEAVASTAHGPVELVPGVLGTAEWHYVLTVARGVEEAAWFARDDPAPFWIMCLRAGLHVSRRALLPNSGSGRVKKGRYCEPLVA